jgi:hypothetical protein
MAAKPSGLKVEKTEVSQEIDLVDVFDGKVTTEAKVEFVNRVIEKMIERTQDGISRGQRSFEPYSKEYAEKKGVGVKDVDLTLFGDMLGSIEAKFLRGQKAKVYIDGKKNNLKAYNHMTPKDETNRLPKREFFGMTKRQLKEVAYEIIDELGEENVYDEEAFA